MSNGYNSISVCQSSTGKKRQPGEHKKSNGRKRSVDAIPTGNVHTLGVNFTQLHAVASHHMLSKLGSFGTKLKN